MSFGNEFLWFYVFEKKKPFLAKITPITIIEELQTIIKMLSGCMFITISVY